MKIFHALFSNQRGGLEQAFLDYSEALAAKGHMLILAVHPKAQFKERLVALKHDIQTFEPSGYYDLRAIWQIRSAIKKARPDMVLAHNSRAVSLLKWATLGLSIPLVGVSHSYKTKYMMLANYVLVLTDDMRNHFIKAGYAANRCFVMPNMIRQVSAEYRTINPVPIIGGIGRLVYEKGFHLLVQAMAELSRRDVICRAIIAGEGIEKESLQRFAADIGVADLISWAGWVEDKRYFYDTVDLIVLPSLSETFGLVVLEAMTHIKPVISSNTAGPASIIEHQKNGLLFRNGDVLELVEAIQILIHDHNLAERLAKAGKSCSEDFSQERFADRLDRLITNNIKVQSS